MNMKKLWYFVLLSTILGFMLWCALPWKEIWLFNKICPFIGIVYLISQYEDAYDEPEK